MTPQTPTNNTPYVPGHGDWSYGVESYNVDLVYKVATNRLEARATLAVVAYEDTTKITLDFATLSIDKVRVGGTTAKYSHRQRKLAVSIPGGLKAGGRCSIEVHYAGKPRPVPGPDGAAGWEELTDGAFILSQPNGAPSWLPCNDRPSDKATYNLAITVDKNYHVAANGVLLSKTTRSGRTTWNYAQDAPMATYLATIQIGVYTQRRIDSRIPITIASPQGIKVTDGTAFARQADMMTTFEELFGPYPFRSYQVVITDDKLEIPLEAQAVATFGKNHTTPGWANERLVAHELSHQWFGNSLTLSAWNDIWLHEGFACYSEWLWSQASGQKSTQEHVDHHYNRLTNLPQNLILTDPGRRAMFDDRVYKRGALALHAFRHYLGDTAFFDMLRTWATNNVHGTVTTEMLLQHLVSYADPALRDLAETWLHDPLLPPRPTTEEL